MSSTRKIGWGILGTASIARRQAIPAIQKSNHGTVVAVGSRDLAKARAYADELGIPVSYGSYDEILQDPHIDAVYIALPNHLHLEWTIKAAQAGKHVLCEKPIGLDASQVKEIQQVAANTGVQIMEAIPSYFHPLHRRVADVIRRGTIGQPVFLRFSLGWSFRDAPGDFRWKKEYGGGALLDLGCYPISVARVLTGDEPEWVTARATFTSKPPASSDTSGFSDTVGARDTSDLSVDTNVAMLLSFPSSTALIDIGILTASRNEYTVIGTDGKITVTSPFGNRADSRGWTVYDHTGQIVDQEEVSANQMEIQFQQVCECLAKGEKLPISLLESLANTIVLDACAESALAGGSKIIL